MSEKRHWCDKQVISHLAFVPSIPIALSREPPFTEPLFFIAPLVVLSTLWHRHREPVGTVLSRTERASAFLLYFYGCAQLFYSPTPISLVVCSACSVVTAVVWFLTHPRVDRIDWDTCHYLGLHVVPGAWAAVVGWYNFPIFT